MNDDETLLIQFVPLGLVTVHAESCYINILVMASPLDHEISLRVLELDESLKGKYKNQVSLRVLGELAVKSIRSKRFSNFMVA